MCGWIDSFQLNGLLKLPLLKGLPGNSYSLWASANQRFAVTVMHICPRLLVSLFQISRVVYLTIIYFSWPTSCCRRCCRICSIFHGDRLLLAWTLNIGLTSSEQRAGLHRDTPPIPLWDSSDTLNVCVAVITCIIVEECSGRVYNNNVVFAYVIHNPFYFLYICSINAITYFPSKSIPQSVRSHSLCGFCKLWYFAINKHGYSQYDAPHVLGPLQPCAGYTNTN